MILSFFSVVILAIRCKKPNEFGQKLYPITVFFALKACRYDKTNLPENQVFFEKFI